MKKKMLIKAQKLAISRGGRCLSEDYINARTKMLWQCKLGHQWNTIYGIIRSGSWCPICARNKYRNTLDDAVKLAHSRDGYCKSLKYVNNNEKMLWECEFGHQWEAQYNAIQSGNWCPDCSRNRRKTIEDAIKLARSRGGRCLSTVYTNNSKKLKFQCSDGHIFYASYSNINAGKWCNKCGRNALKNTMKDCNDIAKKNDGKCLSSEYINNDTPMLWECKLGPRYRTLVSGHWCPVCNRYGGVKQNKLANIIGKILNTKVIQNFRGFEWLINDKTGMRLEIDIWIPKYKIAIEYDGMQHFMGVNFGNMTKRQIENTFELIKYRDQIKKDKMINNTNISIFLRFNYKDNITTGAVREKFLSFLRENNFDLYFKIINMEHQHER